jgi:hypothetical protein
MVTDAMRLAGINHRRINDAIRRPHAPTKPLPWRETMEPAQVQYRILGLAKPFANLTGGQRILVPHLS